MIRGGPCPTLTFIRGETYDVDLEIVDENSAPVDLAAFVGASKGVRAQLKANTAIATAVLATPTLTVRTPTTLGKIRFQLTSVQSTALNSGNAEQTSGVWDLEGFDATTSPETVTKLGTKGNWNCADEVTT
jgi:hypothetical protein